MDNPMRVDHADHSPDDEEINRQHRRRIRRTLVHHLTGLNFQLGELVALAEPVGDLRERLPAALALGREQVDHLVDLL
ncbi:MAG TPA: hypothetical protein QGF58_28300, partial [Myxococcota bacterium]|nr:hypothetical protein [Myxococcota bacterium]